MNEPDQDYKCLKIIFKKLLIEYMIHIRLHVHFVSENNMQEIIHKKYDAYLITHFFCHRLLIKLSLSYLLFSETAPTTLVRLQMVFFVFCIYVSQLSKIKWNMPHTGNFLILISDTVLMARKCCKSFFNVCLLLLNSLG